MVITYGSADAERRGCSACVSAHHTGETRSKTQQRISAKNQAQVNRFYTKHLGRGGVKRQQLRKCCFHSIPVGGLGSTSSLVICVPTGIHTASWHHNPTLHSEFRIFNMSENSICPCTLYKEAEYCLQILCSHPIAERVFLCPLLDSPLVQNLVPKSHSISCFPSVCSNKTI